MADCIGVFLMLVLVAQPCGSFLFGPISCRYKPYNEATHICCGGILREWPNDWVRVVCCVKEMYDPTTQHCCQDGSFEAIVAPIQPNRTRKSSCDEVLQAKKQRKAMKNYAPVNLEPNDDD